MLTTDILPKNRFVLIQRLKKVLFLEKIYLWREILLGVTWENYLCIRVSVWFSVSGVKSSVFMWRNLRKCISKIPELVYARKIHEAGSETSVVVEQPTGVHLQLWFGEFFANPPSKTLIWMKTELKEWVSVMLCISGINLRLWSEGNPWFIYVRESHVWIPLEKGGGGGIEPTKLVSASFNV